MGQQRLLHIARLLGTSVADNTSSSRDGVGHGTKATTTSLTAGAQQQAATDSVDVYSQTLINTWLAQQLQIAAAQTSAANSTNNSQSSTNSSVNSTNSANS